MRLVFLVMASLAVGSTFAADAVCSTGICLADGDSECDRSTGSCPPCMYAISGGYSCYAKVDGECPFPDAISECPEGATTPAPSPTTGASTTAPPSAAPGSTVPPPATVSPQNVDPSGPTATITPATSTPSSAHNSSSVPPLKSAVSTPDSRDQSSNLENQEAFGSDSGEAKASYVNAAIIIGAAFGAMLVGLFIVRRVRDARDDSLDDFDLKTPTNVLPKTYTHEVDSTRRGTQPIYPTTTYPTTTTTATAPTTVYPTTNTTRTTNKINFSNLEQSPVSNPTTRARGMTDRNTISIPPSPPPMPPPASAQIPQYPAYEDYPTQQCQYPTYGVPEDYEQSPPPMNPAQGKNARMRGMDSPLLKKEYPELVASFVSDVSFSSAVQYDEFDIVDPGALHPDEHRTTEALVEDGRFLELSRVQLNESFMSTGTIESDGTDRLGTNEHWV
ncbi:hypothetical protein Poli38472_010460 [Pythium oligandrum]|uniref:Uncharacterized protein n=1 Tax=Pythium oligandrum TaxID=41045 RepID=A0A8K1C346_PYTOL|nr:hypothetical protein Poli38472_010460 [Pythium oligandrum]|eukprot:TMW55578.1 hypothetical protein Poli38472_010460 [Pythium oligandrum]